MYGDGCRCDLCRANEAIYHRAHRVRADDYEDKPEAVEPFALWSLRRQAGWRRGARPGE
jgi:hypothetical protein